MTGDFRAALKSLGLTGRGFALLTGVHEETVSGWGRTRSGRGVQEVPLWAWLLLDAWTAHPETLDAARASETRAQTSRAAQDCHSRPRSDQPAQETP
jgi:hypothetical protein